MSDVDAGPRTVDHFGVKLELDPTFMSPTMIDMITRGGYEAGEAHQIRRLIEPGEVVLEIGAGIGFITTLIARHPQTARVRTYEANPALIPAIRRTLETNTNPARGNWEVVNGILSNSIREPEVDFYVHENFWASSLMPFRNPKSVERVPVHHLNSVLAEMRPTMIVCDIEGGEQDLLLNADLGSVSKVYLEVHQNRLGRRGMRALFESMHARNFHYDQFHSAGSVVLFSHVDRR